MVKAIDRKKEGETIDGMTGHEDDGDSVRILSMKY